eukprot:scaffold1019_cov255-Pinguiococcus_pyrenoidosus.AAC.15
MSSSVMIRRICSDVAKSRMRHMSSSVFRIDDAIMSRTASTARTNLRSSFQTSSFAVPLACLSACIARSITACDMRSAAKLLAELKAASRKYCRNQPEGKHRSFSSWSGSSRSDESPCSSTTRLEMNSDAAAGSALKTRHSVMIHLCTGRVSRLCRRQSKKYDVQMRTVRSCAASHCSGDTPCQWRRLLVPARPSGSHVPTTSSRSRSQSCSASSKTYFCRMKDTLFSSTSC